MSDEDNSESETDNDPEEEEEDDDEEEEEEQQQQQQVHQSLNDKLSAHSEIPISIQSEIPETATSLPTLTATQDAATPAVPTRKRRGNRKKYIPITRQELNPKYNQLSTNARVQGGGFGSGYQPPSSKQKKQNRMLIAMSKSNSQEFLNLQSYKGFGAKTTRKSIEFQPINKDYDEISHLLSLRGGVRGPGQYADGLNNMYKFAGTKNPISKKPTGPRYELDVGKKVKRQTRFDDPTWKLQHLLAGSLNRERSKGNLNRSKKSKTNIDQGEDIDIEEEDEEVDDEKGSTKTPKRKVRPSTAGSTRRNRTKGTPSSAIQFRAKHKKHLQRSKSYKQFDNKRLPVSFGPGFGCSLHTPIRRWKRKNTQKAIKTLDKVGKGKKWIDPAMIPRIQRGSCIQPITTLSKKQVLMLQRAHQRYSGLIPRPKKIPYWRKEKIEKTEQDKNIETKVNELVTKKQNTENKDDDKDKKEEEDEEEEEEEEDEEDEGE
jgi:hypothetical protein